MASRPHRSDAARIVAALERAVSRELPALLPRQRWFGDKGRPIGAVAIRDCAALGARGWLVLVDVTFAAGPDQTYAVPLVLGREGLAPGALSMALEAAGAPALALDAFDDPEFCRELLGAFERRVTVPTCRDGVVRFVRTERFPADAAAHAPRRLTGEQSNTSVIYGASLVFKAIRRIRPGIAIDCEVGAFLTSRARFAHVPPLAGAIEYAPASGPVTTLGVLQGYVANHGDGWSWVTAHLKNLPPERVDALSDDVFRELRGLGAITGELHGALACDPGDADFSPEPIAAADAAAWSARVVDDVGHTCERVRGRLSTLPPELAAGARALVANEAELVARARDLEILGGQRGMKIRVHGDYHLGQTLRTDGGFVVLDFEGEPGRPAADARRKQCALVDVAGMLRSLDYAVQATLPPSGAAVEAGERWVGHASATFLDGYREAAARASVPLLPASPAAFARVLAAFELDKALYEVRYELDNRPAWLAVPLRGLGRLLARERLAS